MCVCVGGGGGSEGEGVWLALSEMILYLFDSVIILV